RDVVGDHGGDGAGRLEVANLGAVGAGAAAHQGDLAAHRGGIAERVAGVEVAIGRARPVLVEVKGGHQLATHSCVTEERAEGGAPADEGADPAGAGDAQPGRAGAVELRGGRGDVGATPDQVVAGDGGLALGCS